MNYRDHIIFLGLSLVIISLLYFSNIREGFVSVNPIPTLDDHNSIGSVNPDGTITGTPNSTMQKVIDFIKNYKWNTPLKPNQENRIADMISFFYAFGISYENLNTLVNGYTTKPTFQQFANDVNKLSKKPLPDSVISNIIQNSQMSSELFLEVYYAVYNYIFGDQPSSTTSNSKSSSTQQPLTMYIPQPCSPSFKSIPGGAVDINCFN
jgi:hypothetical protein